MAKYGLFTLMSEKPMQEYEGDYLGQLNEFVQIFKRVPDSSGQMVAAINLDKGQSVKEIKEHS
jgi:hypothetical protein